MRVLLLFTAIFMVASAGFIDSTVDWVKGAGSSIVDAGESVVNFFSDIFGENMKKVNEHNKLYDKGESSYKLGLIKEFENKSFNDIKLQYTGLKKNGGALSQIQDYEFPERNENRNADVTADWRRRGAVTKVIMQGKFGECGSCWAFGTVAAIEAQIKIRTGKLTTLSPQHLIDCSRHFHNDGCDGGYQDYAFAYIAKNGGIALEKDYRYTGKSGKCQYNPSKPKFAIKGFTKIPANDEEKMKQIISHIGPLACGVVVTEDFSQYKGGIFDDPSCSSSLEPNHIVAVIGYGEDHWLIKNSWGHTWGENGYMQLAFNNMCGIASECSYPVF